MNTFFQKLWYALERLSSRPIVGGLQLSDAAAQYVVIDTEPRTLSLRFPPGVIQDGKIASQEQLTESLVQLRDTIDPTERTRVIPVVVALPPAAIFAQGFRIPNVGSERLEESASLNIQMISPLPKDEVYMGWQIIRETPDHYELLGAFAEKKFIDAVAASLESARFYPIAFEFPSLALTRLIAESMPASTEPTLVLNVSSSGLDFFVCREQGVQFDYFRSWQSIQGENREISRELFERVIADEVQKVLNFSLSRFQEEVHKVLLLAPGFDAEIKGFLEKRFALQVTSLVFSQWPLNPTWYVALGAALRGRVDRSKDVAISLAPVSSVELFYEEQFLSFIRLWRNIIGSVFLLFIIFFAGVAYVEVKQSQAAEQQLTLFSDESQRAELESLRKKVSEFNMLVSSIQSVRAGEQPWQLFIDRIRVLTARHKIVIDQLDVGSLNGESPLTLNAHATDSNFVLVFRDALIADKFFTDIDLPVSRIVPRGDGGVSFVMTFRFQINEQGEE